MELRPSRLGCPRTEAPPTEVGIERGRELIEEPEHEIAGGRCALLDVLDRSHEHVDSRLRAPSRSGRWNPSRASSGDGDLGLDPITGCPQHR